MTTAHISLRRVWRLSVTLVIALAMTALSLPAQAGPCGADPTVNFDNEEVVRQPEGNVNDEDVPETTTLTFTVILGCEPLEDVTVAWETVPIRAEPDDPNTEEVEAASDYYPSGPDVVFPALSSEEQTIEITVYGDTVVEADETFKVRLVEVTSTSTVDGQPNASVGDVDEAIGTIRNDDVYVSVADGSATEGNPVGFRVSMIDADGQPVTSAYDIEINYGTSDHGSAEDENGDGDYTSADDTVDSVTVDAGDSSALIPIPTTDDGDAEDDETFALELTAITNAIFERGADTISATGTILDDEPRVWISDVTQPEGHSGTTDFEFEVHIDPPADEEVVVAYETVDGTATADEDYIPRSRESSELTFPAGSDEVQSLTVQVKGDTEGEDDQTFSVKLSLPDGHAPNVSLDDPGVGTILDDDDPTISLVDGQVAEGDDGETPALDLTVELVDDNGDPQPAGEDIVLEYFTMKAQTTTAATPDKDYQHVDSGSPATVTIPAGEATWSLPVTVFGDDVDETDEVFTVTIQDADESNPDLMIGVDTATGTILDDDGPPAITIGDADKVEGDAFERFMEFPVRLSHPSDDPVTVTFNTDDGTAQDADGDYESKDGTLTFEDHETEKIVAVKIFGDTEPEANETFVVRLTEPVNGQFPDGADRIEGTGTIVNDDGPGVSVNDVILDEGDSSARDAVFEVTADTDDHEGFTVDVATADGTATVGQDYAPLETTLTFDAGETTSTVSVPVNGDTDHEDDETFTLNLSKADFAAITDGEGVATIVNDDAAPVDDGDGGTDGDGDGGADGDGGGDDGTTGDDDGTTDDGPDLGEVSRSAGATRIETALQVSRDHWDQAPDVVLANAATFPDALAGGTLSALLDAPLLLTFPDQLSDGVATELERLGTQTVWILGGPVAVSVEIQQQLVDAGYQVHRFFGNDRFATAAEIARGTGPSQAGEVVLTLGAHADPNRAWPDALSAGALAAVPDPLPVLLTRTDSLPEATTSVLSELQVATVYLLGGPVAISQDVEAELTGLGYEVIRLAGATRYGTSVATATEAMRRHGDTGAEDVVLATGQNFPDGLAAGALAARLNGLLLLVPSDQLADEAAEFLSAHARRLDRGVIVGGEQAVGANVAARVADALVADG